LKQVGAWLRDLFEQGLVSEPWDKMYDPDELTLPAVTEGEHKKNPPHFKMTQMENPDSSIFQEKDGSGCHGCQSHLRDEKTNYRNHPYGELFDLESDPNEINNLWDSPEHAAVKSELLLKFLHDTPKWGWSSFGCPESPTREGSPCLFGNEQTVALSEFVVGDRLDARGSFAKTLNVIPAHPAKSVLSGL